MFLKRLFASAFILASTGCSPRAPVAGATDGPHVPSQRNRDLITQDDLSADPILRAQSVLEVVRALRPHFLNDRGNNTIQDQSAALSDPEAGHVHASIDGGRVVPIGELNGMHANEVIEIRFLNAGQAMQKFGTAARQGPIILVTTMKQ